eukprot:Rmarinus@m.17237
MLGPRNPLKRLYKYVLKKILGKYLKHPLNHEQIEVDLTQGEVQLSDLALSTEAINTILGPSSPVLCKSAFIHHVKLDIPWKNIVEKDCSVSLDTVLITFVPAAQFVPDGDNSMTASRMSTASTEHSIAGSIRVDPTYESDEDEEKEGNVREMEGLEILERLMERILARTKVSISNLSIRLITADDKSERDSMMEHAIALEFPSIEYGDDSSSEVAAMMSTQRQSTQSPLFCPKSVEFTGWRVVYATQSGSGSILSSSEDGEDEYSACLRSGRTLICGGEDMDRVRIHLNLADGDHGSSFGNIASMQLNIFMHSVNVLLLSRDPGTLSNVLSACVPCETPVPASTSSAEAAVRSWSMYQSMHISKRDASVLEQLHGFRSEVSDSVSSSEMTSFLDCEEDEDMLRTQLFETCASLKAPVTSVYDDCLDASYLALQQAPLQITCRFTLLRGTAWLLYEDVSAEKVEEIIQQKLADDSQIRGTASSTESRSSRRAQKPRVCVPLSQVQNCTVGCSHMLVEVGNVVCSAYNNVQDGSSVAELSLATLDVFEILKPVMFAIRGSDKKYHVMHVVSFDRRILDTIQQVTGAATVDRQPTVINCQVVNSLGVNKPPSRKISISLAPAIVNLDVGILERLDGFLSGKTESFVVDDIEADGEKIIKSYATPSPAGAPLKAHSPTYPAAEVTLSVTCPWVVVQAFFLVETHQSKNTLYRPEVILSEFRALRATNNSREQPRTASRLDQSCLLGGSSYLVEADSITILLADHFLSGKSAHVNQDSVRTMFSAFSDNGPRSKPSVHVVQRPPSSDEYLNEQPVDKPPVEPAKLDDPRFYERTVRLSRYYVDVNVPYSEINLVKPDYHLLMELIDICSGMTEIAAGYSYILTCGIEKHSVFHTRNCRNPKSRARTCTDLTRNTTVALRGWRHLATMELNFLEGRWHYQEMHSWMLQKPSGAARPSLCAVRLPFAYEWNFRHQRLRHISQYNGRPVVSMLFMAEEVTIADRMIGSNSKIASLTRFARVVSVPHVFQLGYVYSLDAVGNIPKRDYHYNIIFTGLLFKHEETVNWWNHTMDFITDDRPRRSSSFHNLAAADTLSAADDQALPHQTLEVQSTNAFSHLNVQLNNCSLEMKPRNLPSRLIIAAERVAVSSHLVRLSPNTTFKYRFENIAVFLLDNIANCPQVQPPSGVHQELAAAVHSCLRSLGYAKIMTVSFIELLTRSFKKSMPSSILTINAGTIVFETCADSYAYLVAFLNDYGQPVQPTEAVSQVTYSEKHHPPGEARNILANISDTTFGPSQTDVSEGPPTPTRNVEINFVDDHFTHEKEIADDLGNTTCGSETEGELSQQLQTPRSMYQSFPALLSVGEANAADSLDSSISVAGSAAAMATLDAFDDRSSPVQQSSQASEPSEGEEVPLDLNDYDILVFDEIEDIPSAPSQQNPTGSLATGTLPFVGRIPGLSRWMGPSREERSKEYEQQLRRNAAKLPEQAGGWLQTPHINKRFLLSKMGAEEEPLVLSTDYPVAVSEIIVKDVCFVWRLFDGNDFSSTPPRAKDPHHPAELVPGRQERQYMELLVNHTKLHYYRFPPGKIHSWHLQLSIQDIGIGDRLYTSRWKNFMTDWTGPNMPREHGSNMVELVLDSVHPDPNLTAEEYRLRVAILPLKFHIHQDAVEFFGVFFASAGTGSDGPSVDADPPATTRCATEGAPEQAARRSSDPPSQEGADDCSAAFIQFVEIRSLSVAIDYRPKRVNLKALREGNLAELMNILPLEGVEIDLKRVNLTGIHGWDKVIVELLSQWLEDICSTQLHRCLGGVPPVRSLYNLGNSLADFLLIPIQQYKKDRRILRGIRRGTASLFKTVTVEALNLTADTIVGTQVLLEHADDILSGSPERMPSRGAIVDRSKYATQPRDASEGVHQAYSSLTKGLAEAHRNLVYVPLSAYEKAGSPGTIKAAIRAVPVAVLQPFIGAAEAMSKALLGIRNTMDPHSYRDDHSKYKLPTTPR